MWFVGWPRPGGRLVIAEGVAEAVPEFAEQLVGEVAQGGVVGVAGGAASVVVSPGAGRFGQRGEGPPVAGIAEAAVADASGADDAAAAGGPGDRSGPGEAADAADVVEAVRVVAELAQHAGAEDGSEAGHAGDDRGLDRAGRTGRRVRPRARRWPGSSH